MEENIAILIADLSGYTSLTETHGSIAAADLIDKYVRIVEISLVGESRLHERTGDEVLIVSPSANDLLFTSYALIQNTSTEHEFLQLHGGLHFGGILHRDNHYFGKTINLASRIANEASRGTIWCSEDFINALEDSSQFNFDYRGEYSFKNFTGKTKVFELVIQYGEKLYIDPVCRMLITDPTKAIPHPENKELYFCSETCLDIYLHK